MINRRAIVMGAGALAFGAAARPLVAGAGPEATQRKFLIGHESENGMTTTKLDMNLWSGGLTPDHELFFPNKPDDPEMRESTSIWLVEENGEFAIPRVGIEGEGHSWENRLYHANFAFRDGRILHATGRGAVPPPFGPDGRATVFGAGPMTFRLIEPFRRWAMTFEGMTVDTSVSAQIAQSVDESKMVPLKYEIEMEMVAPCWVQDYSPDKFTKMSKSEQEDAIGIGIGWRLEQQFTASGALSVDGETRSFRARGNRVKRQSVRGFSTLRGHAWQAGSFADGRAFASLAYPPLPDGNTHNEAYIFQDGKIYPARVSGAPWLRRLIPNGDDVSLELESELGTTQIAGTTILSSFRVNNPEMGNLGLTLHQSAARYTWGDQTSYGMLERSAFQKQITF